MDEGMTEKMAYLNTCLNRNLAWVSAADQKVAPVFTIDLAMLGVLCGVAPKVGQWPLAVGICAGLSGLALLASMILLACVGFPRLKGPKDSAVFFGGIANHDKAMFVEKMLGGVTREMLEDVARQTHRNAEIACQKFAHVRAAMILMFASIPFWMVAVAVLYGGKAG